MIREAPQEGVVKFEARHRSTALDLRRYGETACRLLAWREVLGRLGLVGQDAARYQGVAYGNVSARVGPPGAPRRERAFLITGTGTAGRACADPAMLCVVERCDPARNQVESHGPSTPSSEAMTHGTLYDLGAHVRWVFHAHAPVLWQAAAALRLPTTPPEVEYGTPAMARAIEALWRSGGLGERRILAMAGHEDGVVAFGRSAEEAGEVLVRHLALAYERVCSTGTALCRDR
jgi:ribulose-5-phosphate 4-epimerase/fuculose-1-phosphate aldolase